LENRKKLKKEKYAIKRICSEVSVNSPGNPWRQSGKNEVVGEKDLCGIIDYRSIDLFVDTACSIHSNITVQTLERLRQKNNNWPLNKKLANKQYKKMGKVERK